MMKCGSYVFVIVFTFASVVQDVTAQTTVIPYNPEVEQKVFDIFTCECVPADPCSVIVGDPTGSVVIQERVNECPHEKKSCCNNTIPNNTDRLGEMGNQKCGERQVRGAPIFRDNVQVGVHDSLLGEFPWMAALLNRLEDGEMTFACGASLIHPNAVLTAAHCVINQEDELVVRLGEHNPQATDEMLGHEERVSSQIVIHPKYYSAALYNDIALVFWDKPIKYQKHIKPICLPELNEVVQDSTCYMTGWGRNPEGTTGIFTKVLEGLKLKMVPNLRCQDALRKSKAGPRFNLSETFVCAGGDGLDACKGDGGGPLVCRIPNQVQRYRQVGIVSWGEECGAYPGVYTNVPMYVNWILEQLAARQLTYSSTFSLN